MGYCYHTDAWPVVRFEFIGRLTADEINQYLADSDSLIAAGKPFASVMDGSNMLLPEAEYVRKQAIWVRDHVEDMRRLNSGIAFVVRSTLVRGVVRAVMHFQEIPVPHDWFANVDEAMAWAATQAANKRSLQPRSRLPPSRPGQ